MKGLDSGNSQKSYNEINFDLPFLTYNSAKIQTGVVITKAISCLRSANADYCLGI
jgi:hypothetical protein